MLKTLVKTSTVALKLGLPLKLVPCYPVRKGDEQKWIIVVDMKTRH